jgi:alpha-glucosidase
VNFGPDLADLPAGDVVLASGPLHDGRIPTDTAVWIRS